MSHEDTQRSGNRRVPVDPGCCVCWTTPTTGVNRQGRTVTENNGSQDFPDRRLELIRHPESLLSPREQLALALDGHLPTGDLEAHHGYRLAGRLLLPHLQHVYAALGLAPGTMFSVLNSRYDHMDRLLIAAGFAQNVHAEALRRAGHDRFAPVLLVGSDAQPSTDVMVRAHLQSGGLVVTSDRAADLPVFASAGVLTRRGSSRHVRIDRASPARGDFTDPFAIGRLQPAVRLSAGHREVYGVAHPEQVIAVLAREASTRLPLVMLARVGNGFLLHSVAHWWQNEMPDRTDLGRRELRRTPGFGPITSDGTRWGEFHAGYCMLSCLIRSMQMLARVGGPFGGPPAQVAA